MIAMMKLVAAAQFNCLGAQGGDNTTPYCDTGLPKTVANGGQLQHFLQITFGIMAVITVLIIIISALNIVYADGDSQKVAKARSSILYALVGLVTMLLAEAVVTFVVGKF